MWLAVLLSALALAGQFVPWLAWAAIPFWAVVPGLLLVRAFPATGVLTVGLVPVLSVAFLVLLSTGALWAGAWNAWIGTIVVTSLSLVYAATGLRRLRRPRLPAFPAWDGWTLTALGLGIAALVLWLVTLPQVSAFDPDPYGLLLSDKWTFGAALLAVAVALLIGLRRGHVPLLWLLLAIACLIQRGTTPLTLNTAWADWAYKHIGVIDLIDATGMVHRGVDIYQGWPGFFAALAWVSGFTGVPAIEIAVWFTLAMTVATMLALYALARSLEFSAVESLGVAMIALMANWVGQDYFSPQAFGFILAIGTITLALRAKHSRSAWVLALISFGALVITHQLTPFWLLGAMGVLCLFRRVPWLLMIACGVLTGAQLAANFDIADAYGLFTGFDIVRNAETPAAGATPSSALAVQMVAGRGTSIGLWTISALIALAALIRQRWRGWVRGLGPVTGVLAFSPFVILGGQSYGGEALLRVLLYSVPGCALLIGPWLVRRLQAGVWQRLVGGIVALFFVIAGAHAYFATFYHYGVTRTEYEVQAMLERSVPGTAYMSPLSAYWPVRASEAYAWRLAQHWDYDGPLHNLGDGLKSPDYLAVLEGTLNDRGAPTFVLIGPRMDAFAAYGGFGTLGGIEEIRKTLPQRPGWDLILERDGVSVIRYVPEHTKDQEASRWTP